MERRITKTITEELTGQGITLEMMEEGVYLRYPGGGVELTWGTALALVGAICDANSNFLKQEVEVRVQAKVESDAGNRQG